jgi:hypothetical protein
MAIRMRKNSPRKKRVEVGRLAPMRWVMPCSRSYHNASIRIIDPVRSHSHEYSSLSFFLLTSSIMKKRRKRLMTIAKIFCFMGILYHFPG